MKELLVQVSQVSCSVTLKAAACKREVVLSALFLDLRRFRRFRRFRKMRKESKGKFEICFGFNVWKLV